MTNKLLKGKRGIIFGALNEDSIAWKVAEKAKQHGAIFTLTNTKVAARLGNIEELAENCGCKFIPADAKALPRRRILISWYVGGSYGSYRKMPGGGRSLEINGIRI